MKKKLFIITLALTLIFVFTFTLPSSAQTVTRVTAVTEGNSNVLFSNGYRGYCIDMNMHYADIGDVFEEADTSLATSNIDGSDISAYLKALFVVKFDYLFVSDGNGGYELDFDKKDSLLPAIIWNFSDNRYIWGEQKTIADEIKAYAGPAIPDVGYTITLDNGDVITFYFLVMHPEDQDTQDFFSYKIAVNEQSVHIHDYDEDNYKYNDDEHWYECECGDKKDVTPHDGNEPDCKNPSVCEDCGKQLEDVDPDNHTGNTEVKDDKPASEFEEGYTGDTYCKDCGELLEKGSETPATHIHDYDEDNYKYDDDEHWYECECGDKKDVTPHDFKDGVCENCNKADESTSGNNQSPNQNSSNTNNDNNSGSYENNGENNNSNGNNQVDNPNTDSVSYGGLLMALAFISFNGIILVRRKKNIIA